MKGDHCMKIVILNGSPRKSGNTAAVLKKLEEQLSEHNAVEVLDISRLKLSPCMACDSCHSNGGHCVCPDDSAAVIKKIAAADAVILGTPVYWWGMSAQLKMAVDKFYSQSTPFKAMKKKMGLVVVGANTLDNPQYRLIIEQTACIAKYLNWKLSFTMSFSAYEPGSVTADAHLQAKIEEAVNSLCKE